MRTPEGFEKDDIKKHLISIGAWFILPYMAGFGKSGVPDIICCIKGRFISVEVKREGKTPTPRQEKRIAEIQEAGGIALWGTADVVIRQLRGLDL